MEIPDTRAELYFGDVIMHRKVLAVRFMPVTSFPVGCKQEQNHAEQIHTEPWISKCVTVDQRQDHTVS